jgi:hypothetical protein
MTHSHVGIFDSWLGTVVERKRGRLERQVHDREGNEGQREQEQDQESQA